MSHSLGQHAIVIGGSVAGLLASRVLADHFEKVTILERDVLADHPDFRTSIPQSRHYHALLLGGQRVLSSLFPGFVTRLRELGATKVRVGTEAVWIFPDGLAYSPTGGRRQPFDLGFDAHSQSRELIEFCLREFALAVPGVELLSSCRVQQLTSENGRVKGVRVESQGDSEDLLADLVVDACGRGSRTPAWLTEMGFEAPRDTTIGVDIGYASTKFRRSDSDDGNTDDGDTDDSDRPAKVIIHSAVAPTLHNAAIFGQIEGDRWHLSVVGRFGEYPPTDEAALYAYLRDLPPRQVSRARLYDLVRNAERLEDIVAYRFPASVLRHYEQLTDFPAGYLVIGDALTFYNPVYGQGISSSALQADRLRHLLAARRDASQDLDGLALEFFRQAAQVNLTPWTLAASQDLAFPQTQAEERPDNTEQGMYFMALSALEAEDPEVFRLTTEVFHLARPLSDLFTEPLRSRVVEVMQRGG